MRLFEESLALHRALGDRRTTAGALHRLGRVVGGEGDLERATGLQREALALFSEMGDRVGAAECLEGIAAIPGERGQTERAATLLGVAAGRRAAIGAPKPAGG